MKLTLKTHSKITDLLCEDCLGKYKKSVGKFIKRPVLSWSLLAGAALLLFIFMRGLPFQRLRGCRRGIGIRHRRCIREARGRRPRF